MLQTKYSSIEPIITFKLEKGVELFKSLARARIYAMEKATQHDVQECGVSSMEEQQDLCFTPSYAHILYTVLYTMCLLCVLSCMSRGVTELKILAH